MDSLDHARTVHRKRSVRWGYIWAFWCAVFWGLWYLPGTAIWHTPPFSSMDFNNIGEFLGAAVVITTLNAIGVLLFLLLWLAWLEKLGEFFRTLLRFRKISLWYFLSAIFGGPCALLGSYLAIGYVGPVFAAVATLLYPIVGAILAHFWYYERISPRAALGISVIVLGGVSVFAPGLLSETASTNNLVWLGYLGGVLAAFGWGVEGAVAGRVLDVTDPDVGITIRFLAEVIFWIFPLLPLTAFYFAIPVGDVIGAAMNLRAITWLAMGGMTFAFCYVAWYKSFPLIGVGRGQAIGDLHGVFAVIFLAVFAFHIPDWYFLIGLALTVSGGFLMISEPEENVEVVRDPVADQRIVELAGHRGIERGRLHMKGFVLRLLADAADEGLWDYEIMQEVFREYRRDGTYWKGEVRATLTDLFSGALIEQSGDALDDGRHFGEGKLLMKFRISRFGIERMVETGLV